MFRILSTTVLTICILSLFPCSCISLKQPSNKVLYYILEYDPPVKHKGDSLSCPIKIERFSVAPVYDTTQIIYRVEQFSRDAYVYHKWRANPGDLVTYFLSRDMKQSGLLKAVLPHDSRIPSSYMLEGSVDEFFEWEMEEAWKAVLALSITLMSENEPDISKRILFQKTYRAGEECKQKNPRALAEAMSRAMAKVSGEIIKDVYEYLKK